MKALFTILTFFITASVSFGQFDYNITLPASRANKNTVLEIEKSLHTYNRNITGNIFSFSSAIDYSESYLDSIFHSVGKSPVSVEKFRGVPTDMEKAGGNNCESAQNLCNNASLPGNSGGFGVQELNGTNRGCLVGNEHQSSWYYLNVLTPGALQMRINPDNGTDDYDFAIWGPFTSATAALNCPPVNDPIRCSFAASGGATGLRSGSGDISEGAGGDKWVNPLTVTTGQIYILLVDNFSVSGSGYTIDFSWGLNLSTATLGCLPVILPVEVSSFSGEHTYGENLLSWTSESEINNNYYTLESSTTGNQYDWTEVEKIQGAGNSTEQLHYVVRDIKYAKGVINYYRLIQTDYDGKTTVIEKKVAIDNRTEAKQIAKVINLLGQEVSEDEKGIVILIFEDGTQEKRFN